MTTTATATALDRTIVASLRDATWEQGVHGQWLAHLIHRGNTPGCHTSLRAVLMPPGHLAGAHRHRAHEVQVMVLRGIAASLVGDDLTPVVHTVGDPIRIAAGDTHAAVNLSTSHWLLAIETFSDPHSSDVHTLPSLDHQVAEIADQLRAERAEEIRHYESHTLESVFDALVTGITTIPRNRIEL